jgi:hypothetical protein
MLHLLAEGHESGDTNHENAVKTLEVSKKDLLSRWKA